MNTFFGIGPFEMILIAVLALIFIGPQRLPTVIAQVMKVVRDLRSFASDAQDQLRGEFGDVREYFEEVVKDVNEVARDITAQANEIASETQSVVSAASAQMTAPAAAVATVPDAPRAIEEVTRPEEFPVVPTAASASVNGAALLDDRPSFGDYRPS